MQVNPMPAAVRLADRTERALWDGPDARAAAAGFQVVRLGRWQRRYRHPRMAMALAAVAARDVDELRGAA